MAINSDVAINEMDLKKDNVNNEGSDSDESSSSFHSLNDQMEKLRTDDIDEFEISHSEEKEIFEDSSNLGFGRSNSPINEDYDDSSEKYDNGAYSINDGDESSKKDKYFIDEDYIGDLDANCADEEKSKRHESALEKKNEGNVLFKKQLYEEAALIYTEGLQQCPLSYEKDRAILYANRAAARSKLDEEKQKKAALKDCDKAIALDPSYLKAILRRANLHKELDNLEEALKDFKLILEMDPSNAEAQYAIATLPKQIEEKNEKLKEEMLGKLKELGNVILKPFGLSTNNFQLQQNPETGGYNISFNQQPS